VRIYLLRHGALEGDSRNRFVGQIDLPLAPEGRTQAEALGRALHGLGLDAVYCSDLLRSRQTAEIIAGTTGIPLHRRADLREIALGDWEGLSRQEVASRFPAQYAARGEDIEHYRIPGGESFADCRERVLAAWREILQREERAVAIVGHAGANRVLLCHLLGIPVERMFSLGQDYGCVNVIECVAGNAEVRLINHRPSDMPPLATEPNTGFQPAAPHLLKCERTES